MACFRPLYGYLSSYRTEKGKRKIVFNKKDGFVDRKIAIPCGKCIGCKMEKARQWAVRCVHESQLYDDNCFLTLTYDNENLPEGGNLVKRDLQLFMKKLRKKKGEGIKFFACGEYGDKFKRPHYHVILFNCDFKDKVYYKTEFGNKTFISDELRNIWKKGFCIIGEVNAKSASYVARYVTKKVAGEEVNYHYRGREKEFIIMSRKEGIGKKWFEKFGNEVFPNDEVVIEGRLQKPPRYYYNILEKSNKLIYDSVRRIRKEVAELIADDNTEDRLGQKEKCLEAVLKFKKRSYEND